MSAAGRPRRWLLAASLLALQGLASPPAADAGAAEESSTLREGNRLFRAGRIEAALETYASGWDPRSPDPVLAYNLGTTAHHLGRLPEAVLWYRRAAFAGDDDRWLQENLDLARRSLGTSPPPPPGWTARLSHGRGLLLALGAALAWLCLAFQLNGHPSLRRLADPAGLAALAVFLLGLLVPLLAPQPAVLLRDCIQGDTRLAAGREVWGRSAADGSFAVQLPGTEITCPGGTVEPIRP